MKKLYIYLIMCLYSVFSYANPVNFSELFINKNGCFLLYDLNKDKILVDYNPKRCAIRISPASTFKVALSLMVFDRKLIKEDSVFYWDKTDKGLEVWNQDQTPKTWFRNSTVWVSQRLAQQLGMREIQYYLKLFKYGNQDFSGDPGKHNGLSNAWLNSSLKISANEQLIFIKELVTEQLPVSSQAISVTKNNMFLETSPHGWRLFGKTGTVIKAHRINSKNPQIGWFVGFIEKKNQKFIFILNFSDLEKLKENEMGGVRAKNMVKKILNEIQLF